MLVETLSMKFVKARRDASGVAANATNATFPSKVPTITKPSGAGVIELCSPDKGAVAQNGIVLIPYGTGSDNNTFELRVIGWRLVTNDEGKAGLWIPVLLVELHCTLSAAVGVAGATVVNTERFADTISLTTGNDDVSVDIVSPTGEIIAHAMLDLKGFNLVETTFSINSGGTTDMNCLYALL